MNPAERRKAFAVADVTRVDFIQLPNPFQFVPRTFVSYSDRIGLFVSDREGFGVSLHYPESLRSKAGLCFVAGQVQPNLTKAFEKIRQLLQRQGVAVPDATQSLDGTFTSISDIHENTPLSVGSIVHDGQIAIKLVTIGVQGVFVLDGFETAFGCVPIGQPVEKDRWTTIFNNFLSIWDALTKQ